MNHHFWYQKWESKQIGFHQAHPHELLVRYWPTLKLKEANRVFLPLCGKTLDIHWMLSQGFEVVETGAPEIAGETLLRGLKDIGVSIVDRFEHGLEILQIITFG